MCLTLVRIPASDLGRGDLTSKSLSSSHPQRLFPPEVTLTGIGGEDLEGGHRSPQDTWTLDPLMKPRSKNMMSEVGN